MKLPSWLTGRPSITSGKAPDVPVVASPDVLAATRYGRPESPLATMHALHNAARFDAGLPLLAFHPSLAASAQSHAEWMQAHACVNYWEGDDGPDVFDRLAKYNIRFTTAAENAAFNDGTPDQVMSYWIEHPFFRHDILSTEYSHIGIGKAGPYWCVTFARVIA